MTLEQLLGDLRDYFDDRADIDGGGGPNEAMRLLQAVEREQARLASAAGQLQLAADLVDGATSMLNARFKRCRCCGFDVYESKLEGFLSRQLSETGLKLRNASVKLTAESGAKSAEKESV